MSTNNKFILTETMKKEGFRLLLYWEGGLSRLKGRKMLAGTDQVQKSALEVIFIRPETIEYWLNNPTSGYWKPGEWLKKSQNLRVQEHLEDLIHDKCFRHKLMNWVVTEAN